MIGKTFGPYQVLDKLGAGGMGEVCRAHDTRLGRDVALKVLPGSFAHDDERVRRLEREARVLAALNHPHIAAIYGLEQTDGVLALALELVEGDTLGEKIAGRGLSILEARDVARQIADALEAAHEKGIVHRDVKPANIKVRPDGVVKALDFGIAKALMPEPAAIDEVPTVAVTGTREGLIVVGLAAR
jgi:serine/threonine protein kinase